MSAATQADPALFGLLLAGGHSKRMQRDKAVLPYAGQPQLVRAMAQLGPLVERAFVSVRPDQIDDPQRSAYERIVDLQPGIGPLAGIQAALRAHPDRAWLVLACDLPFLTVATLQHLIARRARTRLATAYRSRSDGQPEPLCAIYEPASRDALESWIASGRLCPRAWLAGADVELLDLPDGQALDNINTAQEYAAASRQVSAAPGGSGASSAPLRLNVRYFALLREQAGRAAEAVQTRARTPRQLYEQLQQERGLKLAPQFLRVAINDEFGDWQQPLADGDTVVFLPPVAGG